MNAFAGIRSKGVKTRPPGFFPWRLEWGLSVFQWGSDPHNPPPIFTLVESYVLALSVRSAVDVVGEERIQ